MQAPSYPLIDMDTYIYLSSHFERLKENMTELGGHKEKVATILTGKFNEENRKEVEAEMIKRYKLGTLLYVETLLRDSLAIVETIKTNL